jgi:hypothetical protein
MLVCHPSMECAYALNASNAVVQIRMLCRRAIYKVGESDGAFAA